MGFLRVVPSSHEKPLPVKYLDNRYFGRHTGQHRTVIQGLEEKASDFMDRSIVLDNVGPGDVAFFHCMVVHASGQNRSSRSRWVFNPRYTDLLEQDLIDRGWYMARYNKPFILPEIHPELVEIVRGDETAN